MWSNIEANNDFYIILSSPHLPKKKIYHSNTTSVGISVISMNYLRNHPLSLNVLNAPHSSLSLLLFIPPRVQYVSSHPWSVNNRRSFSPAWLFSSKGRVCVSICNNSFGTKPNTERNRWKWTQKQRECRAWIPMNKRPMAWASFNQPRPVHFLPKM